MSFLPNKRLSNIISLGFLGGLFLGFLMAKLPVEIITLYGIMSTLAFIFYGWDKYTAKKGKKRVTEKTLHLMGFLFGWPGAALAQQAMRHKTVKLKFRRVFWLTALINIIFFYWLYSQQQEKWFVYFKGLLTSLNLY